MPALILTVVGVEGGSFGTRTYRRELSEAQGDLLQEALAERYALDSAGEQRTPQQMLDAYGPDLFAREARVLNQILTEKRVRTALAGVAMIEG